MTLSRYRVDSDIDGKSRALSAKILELILDSRVSYRQADNALCLTLDKLQQETSPVSVTSVLSDEVSQGVEEQV